METGYVKFNCNWIKAPPSSPEELRELNKWRDELYKLGLVGAHGNIGFGNISIRVGGSNRFIITGSATGVYNMLTEEHYTTVIDFDLERNHLTCIGPIQASSESLTHAVIYQADPNVNAVIHIHSRKLWEILIDTVPTTSRVVEYGTPQIAKEVIRLFYETDLRSRQIFVMGGHEEGIISFGKDLNEAGKIILAKSILSLKAYRALSRCIQKYATG
jgi:L-ribulose-5-phosphate 4-epimerase